MAARALVRIVRSSIACFPLSQSVHMLFWCQILSSSASLWHSICTRKPISMAMLHIKLQLYIIAFIMLEGDEISTELHLII